MGDKMTFGQAIEAMKAGHSVRRKGWNGKGMQIYLEDSLFHHVAAGAFSGSVRRYEPVICMYTADGKHQPGWLASQADMLGEDWELANG